MRLDRGHGSPHDRGGADSYYGRPFDPHYYEAGSYTGKRIDPKSGMTEREIEEYRKGFAENEEAGDHKEWRF